MKFLSASQMYKADEATILNKPISSIDLMENAGLLCFKWIVDNLTIENRSIYIFCGIGNNGGDGLVIARRLIQSGYKVCTFVVNFSKNRSGDFTTNYNRLIDQGHPIIEINKKSDLPDINKNEFIIDAIFGIGLSRKPKGLVKEVIQHLNVSGAEIISIDFPSGLPTDRSTNDQEFHVPDKESIVKANVTLSFQNPKLALVLPENQDYCGDWQLLNIGLDKSFINSLESKYCLIEKKFIKEIFIKRSKFSHKGTFGHSLIVGGSFGKIGATVLASKAALKIGSGLVTAYVPKCGYQIVQISIPEVMVEVDGENKLEFFNYKTQPNAIGIGIGMGVEEKTVVGFKNFLKENKLPLVIDADALNILSNQSGLLELVPNNSIFTPHPKEFERLVGKWDNDYNKLEKLIAFSEKYKSVVVLKGAYSAIAYQGRIYFNSTGNPSLATAGSGDVLTGIITGLIAQNYSALNASILGVYIHGKTADIALENNFSMESFTASDCIHFIGEAINDLSK